MPELVAFHFFGSRMEKKFVIRAVSVQDTGVLSQLAMRSKAYWGYSDEFMQACEDELSVKPDAIGGYRLAESGDEILGFYSLANITALQYELDALFVDPLHIGRGVGRALFNHAKGLATTNQHPVVREYLHGTHV